MSEVSTRKKRPRPRAPPTKRKATSTAGLTRDRIIAAALSQIDEHGLENFSLRTLARRLTVFPTAIYWYVPTRNQLLADVVALALADVPRATRAGAWPGYVRKLFVAYRKALRCHPNVAPLIGSQLVSNASVDLEFLERLLELLSRSGFTGETLVAAYNSLIASLVGFVTQEFAPIPAEEPAQWQREMQLRLASLDSLKFPTLAANMKLLANRAFIFRWQSGSQAPLDQSFTRYIEAQIAALKSLLKS